MVRDLAVLASFIFLFCYRKIEDLYLRRSIYIYIGGIIFDITRCITLVFQITDRQEETYSTRQNTMEVFRIKIDAYQVTIPYYLTLMVFLSLLFSAHTFYVSLRNLVFPQL